MSKKINIEKLLKKLPEKYPDEVKQIDPIDPLVFDRIKKNALNEVLSKKEKRPLGIIPKVAIAVVAIFLFFTITLILAEVPAIKAYKIAVQRFVFNIVNDDERNETNEGQVIESTGFEKLDEELPFRIERPSWVPDDYQLVSVDFIADPDGGYSIFYRYQNQISIDYYIDINIITESSFSLINSLKNREKVIVSGFEVYILTINDDYEINKAMYRNDQDFFITINSTTNKEILIKIIESMY